MSIIEIKNLAKIYDGSQVEVRAVDGVNLSFELGEFTAIVGPSGSGKTTFLNLLGGLDRPTSGEVIVDGVEIWSLNPGKLIDFRLHNIGFVFQAYNLIPVLTAEENVEFIMELQQVSKKERHERAMELLKRVGLEAHADRKPAGLSG